MPKGNNTFNVEALLDGLFPKETLTGLFERRIEELGLTPTTALPLLDVEYRALNGVLKATSKRVDYTIFIKLASFLRIPREKVFSLYLEELEKNFPASTPREKIDFINRHFDLAALRRVGFIDSLTDYQQIESRLNSFLGLDNILDYRIPSLTVAFSSGKKQPKDELTRGLWIEAALRAFTEINNPYQYDKEALLQYFPKLREQTMHVAEGLVNVIKELYKLGVTVIYQAPLPSLHLRGATMNSNGKPCVVLTDYRGFYSTLWFALIHELFHVIFDFEEIQTGTYHISQEDPESPRVEEKEKEADHFAREFLFSKEKSEKIRPHLSNSNYVAQFAGQHHVHPSLIYTFCAFDDGNGNKEAWAKARKRDPNFQDLLRSIENPWNNPKAIREYVKYLKENIYS